MIYDNRMLFSSAQSVVGTAGSGINCTNQYDSGAVTRDLGNGAQLYLLVEVTTDIVAAGAGTFRIDFVSSASNTLSTPTIHASTTLTTAASASAANKTLAGSQAWCIEIPQGVTYLQYLGVIYTPVSQNTSTGAVNCFTSLDPHGYINYPTVANLV